MISGSDQNLGAKTAPFTYQYTVTDAQAATQTITVTEKLTNGTQTITLRTYTATSGAQNTVDLSSVWLPLLSGTHVLTITATDSAGGSATRKITFSRTVSRIAAARAFNTDAGSEGLCFPLSGADSGGRYPSPGSHEQPVRHFAGVGRHHRQGEQTCPRLHEYDRRERLWSGLSLLYHEGNP